MPAISFYQQFIDALLRGDKQQTTRNQTNRVKVGDVAHIYAYDVHIIGKVQITAVFDLIPVERSLAELISWARADGFEDLSDADTWFNAHYGDDWMHKTWTVIRWNGWLERYFEPDQ